jgi:hypothetical protein
MAVVLREPANAGRHHLFGDVATVPPDHEPGEAQVVAVMELRVGQGQAEEGAQKLIVWGHGDQLVSFLTAALRDGRSLLRKRIDPDGSPRWLRRLPCGWCQIPRTFPFGAVTNVGANRVDRNPRDLSPGYVV